MQFIFEVGKKSAGTYLYTQYFVKIFDKQNCSNKPKKCCLTELIIRSVHVHTPTPVRRASSDAAVADKLLKTTLIPKLNAPDRASVLRVHVGKLSRAQK